MSKKDEKKKDECDPVKELAKDVLCALIASNENEDGIETVKKAYEIANAFEDYGT